MRSLYTRRLFKLATVAALILGVLAAGLLSNPAQRALAQSGENTTYFVRAGGGTFGNVEVLAFAPIELQVHRGDTVTWHNDGFHNIRFAEEMANLLIVSDSGEPLLNPVIAFPNVNSGDNYTGGEANSGLPGALDGTLAFSLVIDVETGRYTYFCDVHPGMVGVIEVVEEDTEIPTPAEAELIGEAQLGGEFNKALPIAVQMSTMPVVASTDGSVDVSVGSGATGRATVNLFAPSVVSIKAGEKVVWTNPIDSVDVHFINSLPFDAATIVDFAPVQTDPNAPPQLVVGPGFLGTTEDATSIKAGDSYNSPFIAPGQAFTLIFSEAGIYAYFCHIHPAMNGVVIVE